MQNTIAYEVKVLRVMIAGGGTAGHINPGIAIAQHIKSRSNSAEIIFVGTQRGLESKLIPREGFELKFIKVRGFKRKLTLENFKTLKELFQGILQARRLIREFKPDIVIGTGGYVCGPVLFMASRMKIPTLIHEQNAFPGVTNKLLSRYVDAVAVSFREAEQYFIRAKRLIYTGNPVRSEMLKADRVSSRKKLGISSGTSLVVIAGGSQGAAKINNAVVDMLSGGYRLKNCQIIFATGNLNYEKITKQLEKVELPSVKIVPYIYDMADTMAAADLMVNRGGAITASELTVLGVPSIIIPLPHAAENHQEYNARALEKQGAAVVILEKDLSGEVLYNHIEAILKDTKKLRAMAANSKSLGISDAAERLYEVVEELTGKKRHYR